MVPADLECGDFAGDESGVTILTPGTLRFSRNPVYAETSDTSPRRQLRGRKRRRKFSGCKLFEGNKLARELQGRKQASTAGGRLAAEIGSNECAVSTRSRSSHNTDGILRRLCDLQCTTRKSTIPRKF